MSNERLKTLLINSLIYMDTELVQAINPDKNDIIKFLKDEIGFTDEEIEELGIADKVFPKIKTDKKSFLN